MGWNEIERVADMIRATPIEAGRLAYEADVRQRPTYHDGAPRSPWEGIGEAAQRTWIRNPTPRWSR